MGCQLDSARGAQLARERWARTPKEERSAHARMMVNCRWAKASPKEKARHMRKMVEASPHNCVETTCGCVECHATRLQRTKEQLPVCQRCLDYIAWLDSLPGRKRTKKAVIVPDK